MVARRHPTILALCTLLAASLAHADIYHRYTGELIPRTEGIEPGPGVQLNDMELEYADLRGVDLTGANFEQSNLTGASLRESTLTDTNLTAANLTDAYLYRSTLVGADLSEASVTGADFRRTGLTETQLYSTASYQAKNLQGIGLSAVDLTRWDFSGQDLSYSNFTFADLLDANLSDAIITGASFWITTGGGFTKEQLYSTASYQLKNLYGVSFQGNDLSDWDFSGQDLTNSSFRQAYLIDTNLSGAILKNAWFTLSFRLKYAILDSTTVYNQWTDLDGHDPVSLGLTFRASPAGDFDGNDERDTADVDLLAFVVHHNYVPRSGYPLEAAFDLSDDGVVDEKDYTTWVKELRHTWFGDANLDGEFNSRDLVQVYGVGKYELGWHDRGGVPYGATATWSEGDWNADGIFNSSDMVAAFADGGYENGLRPAAAAVPEPASVLLLIPGLIAVAIFRRRLWS